jgi:hypothetical protein
VHELSKRPVSGLVIGPLNVVLEKTPLDEVKSRFGGSIKNGIVTGTVAVRRPWR